MQNRFVSLYFASIGLREALVLLGATLPASSARAQSRRNELRQAVRDHFADSDCFSFTSARGALSACLKAAGVGPGDEVLLSAFTCLAVPTAVLAIGAKPTYCDIDPRTLNVTPESVVAAMTPKTRAVVVQHTLGSVADVPEIALRARSRGILVVEDCALAIGTRKEGVAVGSAGDAAIFSMELSKTITSGWGGILLVNDDRLASRISEQYAALEQLPSARILRMAIQAAICGVCYEPRIYRLGKYAITLAFRLGFFGVSTPPGEYVGHVATDFVAKLGAPQAALGAHQWKRLRNIAHACEENGSRIRGVLNRLGYVPLGDFGPNLFSVSPRVSFLVADRPAITEWFRERGIELGSWFDGPLSPLPEATAFNYHRQAFPKASFVSEHVVNIPCHCRLNMPDLEHIETVLGEYAAAHPEDSHIQEKLREL